MSNENVVAKKQKFIDGREVPYYNDPDDFDGSKDIEYPHDTQYMTYNPMLHRYTLTVEGLEHYNIDYENYITTSSNQADELCKKASKKVYDFIQYKVGLHLYQLMMYRIATCPTPIYPDKYFTRKQFEECLADQARYLVTNADTAQFSKADLGSGQGDVPPPKPDDAMRNTDDISPETQRTLESLGLLRWFATQGVLLTKQDLTKY